MTLATTLLTSTLALALAVGTAAAADGSGEPRPPAGWSLGDDAYTQMFGDAGDWAPRGTLIVDSGFRPYPNGFPFQNWGDDLESNQLIFGVPRPFPIPTPPGYQPAQETPLNSLAMRRSFGDGVCQDPRAIDPVSGSCVMTATAEVMAKALQEQAAGGHCFGLAAAAAALYNGQLPPNQLGSGLVLSANRLPVPAQQTITRLFVSQYLGGLDGIDQNATPVDVLRTLAADLAGGTVPYILGILGPVGGHAVTPYAIYDRGNGMFDIAVYDNNWPNQPRAVHVDTVTNTFEYSGSTNPQAGGLLWSSADSGNLALASVSDTLTNLTCPICRGRDQGTLVAFSAVKIENRGIDVGIVSPSGQALPPGAVKELSPLNPPSEDDVSLPLFLVAPGTAFRVAVDTSGMKSSESLEIYAMSRGTSRYVAAASVSPGTTQSFLVADRAAEVASSRAASPRLLQTVERPKSSTVLNGHLLAQQRGTTASQEWSPKQRTMIYSSNAKHSTQWNVQADRSTSKHEVAYVALGVTVPAGGTIVIKYGDWVAGQGPSTWIDESGDGTLDRRVRMQPVTDELINQHQDSIYVEQGVG
jgi:hypothetical protein